MSNIFALTLPSPYEVDLREGMAVAATLPQLELTCQITPGVTMSVDAQLPWPMTSVVARGADIALTLPALTGAATGTTVQNLSASITLPQLTCAATATILGTTNFAGTLPAMTAAMSRGSAIGAMELPALTGSATIVPNATTVAAMTLPALKCAATISPMGNVMHASIILPALHGLSGSGYVAAKLPALQASISMTNGTAAVRQAWVMNVKNLAVTKFTGFEFRAFARAFDTYFGVGLDTGMYRMGGDNDAGAAISWAWRTGLSDLSSRALKGVLGLYVDGVAEPGCEFEVLTDRSTVYLYSHKPHGTINDHEPQRVSVGRALRTVSIGYGMKSTTGAYVEIDSITPDYQIHDRRSL